MSGPITRQYGVPNWDEIFGKKEDREANAEQPVKPVDEAQRQGKPTPDPEPDAPDH